MSAIDDLFDQILASEQQAEKSKNLLSEAKIKLTRLEEKIKETQTKLKTANRELTQKQIRLAEQEVSIICWKAKEESCEEQKEALTLELNNLKNKLSGLTKQLEKRQQDFCGKVQNFASSYDLVATAQDHRLQKAKEELYKLQERELSLTRDMLAFNQRRSAVRQLTNEKTSIMDTIEWKNRLLAEKEDAYRKEEKIFDDIAEEKQRVGEIPQTDQQFIQLQKELEEGMQRNNGMERKCATLEKELKDLQRQQWQNQSQRQFMQRRNQQQQQQQQQQNAQQHGTSATTSTGCHPSINNTSPCNTQNQQTKWKFHKAAVGFGKNTINSEMQVSNAMNAN